MLGKAIALAAEKFKHKKDKGGHPYILHCLRVMNDSHGDEAVKCAAVLHDILEDTELQPADLWKMGFTDEVISLVKILTHVPCETYDDYIKRVALYPRAAEIKRADLRDNSNITRMKGLRKKDLDRLEKYFRAYTYLSEV